MTPLPSFAQAPAERLAPRVSFEFFPAKTEKADVALWQTIRRLEPLGPRFVSVTYGAGGSTRERTRETVLRIQRETSLTPAAHLTCVGAACGEIDAVARDFWAAGIRHLVALRGDMPAEPGGPPRRYEPFPGGYPYAAELVAGLRRIADFEISVAAYPETHPDARSAKADLDNLKRKLDAGADRAITQYFFDPELFLRFRDRAAAAGIQAEIVPGILPVSNFAKVVEFSRACGATVPGWMAGLFEGLDQEVDTRMMVAATMAVQLCQALRSHGVDEFHFYTLNRPELVVAICRMLGIRGTPAQTAASESSPAAA